MSVVTLFFRFVILITFKRCTITVMVLVGLLLYVLFYLFLVSLYSVFSFRLLVII